MQHTPGLKNHLEGIAEIWAINYSIQPKNNSEKSQGEYVIFRSLENLTA